MKPRTLDRALLTACVAGILVSTYTMYVEMSIETVPDYQAMCDISEHASCSRVLSSEYAKGFGLISDDSPFKLPNCIYGIVFYCLMILLSSFDQLLVVRLQLLLAANSLLMCVYLGYLLAFVLHDLCVVCVSTYIVNVTLAILVYKKSKLLSEKKKK